MTEKKAGIMLSYLKMLVGISIAFSFTPFLLNNLGNSEYGLYVLAGSFVAYLSVLDLGVNDSTIRFLIKYKKESAYNRGAFLFNVMMMYLVISSIVILIGTCLYPLLSELLSSNFTEDEITKFKSMYVVVIGLVSLSLLFNPISATLVANEKFIFLRLLEIISMILTTLIMVVAISLGYKSYGIFIISACSSVTVLVTKAIYSFSFLKTRLYISRFSITVLKPVLFYSAPILVVILSEQIYWKLDNLIIASMMGPSLVAIYAIGLMFHKYFMGFATAISRVMMPSVISAVDAGASPELMRNILTAVSRTQAHVVFLLLIGLVVLGKDLIYLWLGPEYIDAYFVLLFVMIPYSFELVGNLRNSLLQVHGLYWYRSLIVFFISLINIVLTIYLVEVYGVIGAAISTGVSIVVGYIWVHTILSIKLYIRVKDYLIETYRGIWITFLLVLLISSGMNLIFPVSWGWLFLQGSLLVFSYLIFSWYISFNEDEKLHFSSFFSKLRFKNKEYIQG